MAMRLKREHELLSLRVGLLPAPDGTKVMCVLERGDHGNLKQIKDWVFEPEAFGIPQRVGQRNAAEGFRVPSELTEGVKSAVAGQHAPDGVLWLHLQRPYGYLGAVPWEILSAPTNLVILRLPDVLAPPPREAPDGLDLALCASSPVAKGQIELVRAVANFLQDASAGMRRRVRVHVFADRAVLGTLRAVVPQGKTPNLAVTIHDPADAASYQAPDPDRDVPDQVRRVTNPWLLWIRDAMQGRSLDVAHFIGHGYVSQERGAIALAESPTRNTDTRWARFVGYAELNAFLNQVGAWSVAFTTPKEGREDVGMRLLADQFGQQRPGSVLHHSEHLDEDWSGLMHAYAFLYAAAPATPRAHNGIMMYCQPSRIARAEVVPPDWYDDSDAGRIVRAALNLDTQGTPGWLAASQRYLEQRAFQVKRDFSRTTDAVATDRSSQYGDLQATLGELQGIVARFSGMKGGKL